MKTTAGQHRAIMSLIGRAAFFKGLEKASKLVAASVCAALAIGGLFVLLDPLARFAFSTCLVWNRILVAVSLLGPAAAAWFFFFGRPGHERAALDLEAAHLGLGG